MNEIKDYARNCNCNIEWWCDNIIKWVISVSIKRQLQHQISTKHEEQRIDNIKSMMQSKNIQHAWVTEFFESLDLSHAHVVEFFKLGLFAMDCLQQTLTWHNVTMMFAIIKILFHIFGIITLACIPTHYHNYDTTCALLINYVIFLIYFSDYHFIILLFVSSLDLYCW